MSVSSFFFPAEDGIRDGHVTGVQTCALPISGGNVSVISTGWDPGLFSLNRLLGQAILPEGTDHTFWGKGVSQGHSDAVRRVPGVKAGVQYTVPSESALARVRDRKSVV